jgi:hypothetical protein
MEHFLWKENLKKKKTRRNYFAPALNEQEVEHEHSATFAVHPYLRAISFPSHFCQIQTIFGSSSVEGILCWEIETQTCFLTDVCNQVNVGICSFP